MININIDPVAFLSVRWYGIMVALGILVLILWTVWQVRKGAKLTYDTVFTAALVGIPSGVVVSRLLHVIDRWSYYSHNLGEIIGGSGLTIYGAVLGTALGIWIYSKFAKVRFGYLADVIAPGIILAQAIGRVGCTINGCCYGTETTLPWAIIYNHPNALAPLGVATHPTTVYEIIYLLIIFGVVLELRNRLKPDGSLFMVYLSLYSVWRLGIDFLRNGTPFVFGLHQAQVIAIITLAITIPVLILRTRRMKAEATVPVEDQATKEPSL
jgi:phosphatidylglycerol:prolipoprotein diacylglycerol transferase